MANEKYAYGIASVKFGTPTGSNTMPGSLSQWAQTVQGSLTLSEAEAQTKEFYVEEATTPVHSIITQPGATTITWRAYDLTPDLIEVVKGGTSGTDGASLTWLAPTTLEPMELALEITTTNGVVFEFYKTSVLARFDSVVGREQLLELEAKATVLDPGDGSEPYMITLPVAGSSS